MRVIREVRGTEGRVGDALVPRPPTRTGLTRRIFAASAAPGLVERPGNISTTPTFVGQIRAALCMYDAEGVELGAARPASPSAIWASMARFRSGAPSAFCTAGGHVCVRLTNDSRPSRPFEGRLRLRRADVARRPAAWTGEGAMGPTSWSLLCRVPWTRYHPPALQVVRAGRQVGATGSAPPAPPSEPSRLRVRARPRDRRALAAGRRVPTMHPPSSTTACGGGRCRPPHPAAGRQHS